MYFLLAGSMAKFEHLKTGVSIVLVFVGVKMILHGVFHVPIGWSLAVIAGVLGTSIGASLVSARKS
ncbi:Inner membrane protein alx [compost metagenome]